jgi:hypothetical protein
MPRQKTVLVVLLLVGLTVGLTASSSARAPPQAACGICTDALDRAAADHGVSLTRDKSKMIIQVYENTSTEWTATVRLTDGTAALQNDSLRTAIVSDALDHARMVAEPTHVSSHLSGQTLFVSYRDPGAAEMRGDTIVFTRFYATEPQVPLVSGGEGTPYPGADMLVLRAPDGYTVTGDYESATESEIAVRWHTDGNNGHIDRSTRVTFVNEQSANDALSMGEQSGVGNGIRRTLAVSVLCVVLAGAILIAFAYILSRE